MKRVFCAFCIIAFLSLCFANSHEAQKVVRRPIPSATATPTPSTLLTDLVAYWHFDESSGNATDATGRGNTLTNNNTVTFNTGLLNNAAYFVGASSQYFNIANNADVGMGDVDFTIAMWLYLSSSSDSVIFGKDTDTGRDYYLGLASNTFEWNVFVGGSRKHVDDGVDGGTVTGAWIPIVMWHDATANTINMQIQERTVVSAATTGSLDSNSSAPFRVGARAYPSFEGYMTGRVDSMGMWKRVLTSTERACFRNSGAATEYPFTGLCP